MDSLDRLAVHTITTKPWSVFECIDNYAAAGVSGITFWRRDFEENKPEVVGERARQAGLEVVSVARGGFFPAADSTGRDLAIEDNLRAIDETAAVGAPSLVLVCGAVPGQPLTESRKQIIDGIAACIDHAEKSGVILAIEPLHPMYADDRSAVNTMGQANDICEALGNRPGVGIAADVYHIWWDPDLPTEIDRAGRNGNLTAFHICDWMTPTVDLLNDRGLMGEGCIDIPGIRAMVESAGFSGMNEVEVFSDRHWASDQNEFLKKITEAYKAHV